MNEQNSFGLRHVRLKYLLFNSSSNCIHDPSTRYKCSLHCLQRHKRCDFDTDVLQDFFKTHHHDFTCRYWWNSTQVVWQTALEFDAWKDEHTQNCLANCARPLCDQSLFFTKNSMRIINKKLVSLRLKDSQLFEERRKYDHQILFSYVNNLVSILFGWNAGDTIRLLLQFVKSLRRVKRHLKMMIDLLCIGAFVAQSWHLTDLYFGREIETRLLIDRQYMLRRFSMHFCFTSHNVILPKKGNYFIYQNIVCRNMSLESQHNTRAISYTNSKRFQRLFLPFHSRVKLFVNRGGALPQRHLYPLTSLSTKDSTIQPSYTITYGESIDSCHSTRERNKFERHLLDRVHMLLNRMNQVTPEFPHRIEQYNVSRASSSELLSIVEQAYEDTRTTLGATEDQIGCRFDWTYSYHLVQSKSNNIFLES